MAKIPKDIEAIHHDHCVVYLIFLLSTFRLRPSQEHQYLDRSEEIEGSSDFVAAGERMESKAVSVIDKNFDHQKESISILNPLTWHQN